MKKKRLASLALGFAFSTACPGLGHAEGAAPELFGVREVVIQNSRFTDPKASETCGVTRDQIAAVLKTALAGTTVPAVAVEDAKPLVVGVARIDLIPEIDTHSDDNLDCVSAVSLSAESRANVVVPPVPTLRGVTIVYWRQHTLAYTSQTVHLQTLSLVFQKMTSQFAQQFKVDQPPALPK